MTGQPTSMRCPEGSTSGDTVTHHLAPTGRRTEPVLQCAYCGQTEKQLRDQTP